MTVLIGDSKKSARNSYIDKQFQHNSGQKMNSQKSVAFQYTNDKLIQKEIWETALFTVICNNTKYLWVTLAKQVKTCYWPKNRQVD